MITKQEILYSAMDRANSANINMRNEQLRSLKENKANSDDIKKIENISEQILDLEKNGLKPNEQQSTLFAVMEYALDNISPYKQGRTAQNIEANIKAVKEVVVDLINQGESIAATNRGARNGSYNLFRNAMEPEWMKNGMPLLLLQTALDNGRKEQVQAALNGMPGGVGTIFHALTSGEKSAERRISDAKNANEMIEATEMRRIYSNCALSILEFAKENGLQIPLDYKSKDPVVQEKIDAVQKPMLDEIKAANAARIAAQEEFRVADLKRIAEAKEAAAQQQKQEPAKVESPTRPGLKRTDAVKEGLTSEPVKVEQAAKSRPTLQRADAVKTGLTAEQKPSTFVEQVGGKRQRSDALTSTPPKPIEGVKPDGHAAKVQMGTHRQPTQR